MKSKTIQKVLKVKLNDWINSIKDDKVKELCRKNTIVTGGAIASMLLKEKVNDYDVYFKTKETVLAVAKYYVDLFNAEHGETAMVLDGATATDSDKKAAGFAGSANLTPDRVKIGIKSRGVAGKAVQDDEPFENAVEHIDDIDPEALDTNTEDKYKPVFLSPNAITLSGRIQIVIRFYGEVDELHNNYDFVHCTNHYDLQKNELTLKQEALASLLAKELKYVGSKYPLCSIIRTRKFINRGFTINAGQYLKMAFQLNDLDLSDINVLEDQLIGVDSAYFRQLIHSLKNQMEKDPSFQIETAYITTIIDRIF